jgi:hypothetical protein
MGQRRKGHCKGGKERHKRCSKRLHATACITAIVLDIVDLLWQRFRFLWQRLRNHFDARPQCGPNLREGTSRFAFTDASGDIG